MTPAQQFAILTAGESIAGPLHFETQAEYQAWLKSRDKHG